MSLGGMIFGEDWDSMLSELLRKKLRKYLIYLRVKVHSLDYRQSLFHLSGKPFKTAFYFQFSGLQLEGLNCLYQSVLLYFRTTSPGSPNTA
jgi:hypothetical protein